MRLRIKNKAMLPEYLRHLLESDIMQNEMLDQSLGTGIKNMRAGKELKALYIPIPTIKEQQVIVNRITEKKKSIDGINRKLDDLNLKIKKEVNTLFNS
jgi:type I restriction enzyme S subunit